jgi:hypothetical protein
MILLFTLVILLGVAPVHAGETPTLAERAAAIEHAANEPDGARVVIGHLSRTLRLSAETLRAERTTTGLDWGDLLIAHHMARQGSLRLEDLVTAHRSGKAWEDIARDHAVDVARLTDDVRQSQEAIEQHAEDKGPRGTETGPDKRRGGARPSKGSRTR